MEYGAKLVQMKQLREKTMHCLSGYINLSDRDNRSNEINKRLESIKNKFIEIAETIGIRVNQEYLDGQLAVVKHNIQKTNNQNSEDLLLGINSQLNRCIEEAIEAKTPEESEEVVTRGKIKIENSSEDNGKNRIKSNMRTEMLLNEYVDDIRSNTLRRLFNMGLDSRKIEELSQEFIYRVNQLKYRNIDELLQYSSYTDEQVLAKVQDEADNFFRELSKAIEAKEEEKQEEPKSWELSPDEMENINPIEAVKKAEEKAEEKAQEEDEESKNRPQDLPTDIIL